MHAYELDSPGLTFFRNLGAIELGRAAAVLDLRVLQPRAGERGRDALVGDRARPSLSYDPRRT